MRCRSPYRRGRTKTAASFPEGGTMKLETTAIHPGFASDPTTKAVATPIYQTTSFAFDDTQHGADHFDLKVPRCPTTWCAYRSVSSTSMISSRTWIRRRRRRVNLAKHADPTASAMAPAQAVSTAGVDRRSGRIKPRD
jgi:cystathionine beta-lyase/cystathionine gamma-synthase